MAYLIASSSSSSITRQSPSPMSDPGHMWHAEIYIHTLLLTIDLIFHDPFTGQITRRAADRSIQDDDDDHG